MTDPERQAVDAILPKVAKMTKQDTDIDALGKALKIPTYDIQSAQVENKNGTNHMGSLNLLRTWMNAQTSETMRQTLMDALKETNKENILRECFPVVVADSSGQQSAVGPSHPSPSPHDSCGQQSAVGPSHPSLSPHDSSDQQSAVGFSHPSPSPGDSSGQHGAAGPSHPPPPPADKLQHRTVWPANPSPDELDPEMQYVMWESRVKGKALVIGNAKFSQKGEHPSSPRPWADMDITNMNELLDKLGYKVQDDRNLSTSGMEKAVELFTEQLKRAHPEPQSAVVYISSHGNAEGIEGIDRDILPISILLQKMSGVLLGKPKVLIIDACWGGGETRRLQVSVPNDSSGAQTVTGFPENADIFMIHSTSYGKQAWSLRDKDKRKEGSWFVKQLCEVVYNNNRDLEDLDTIMLRVTKRMRTMTARLDGITDNGTQSTTVVKQGVDRRLFFYPGFQI